MKKIIITILSFLFLLITISTVLLYFDAFNLEDSYYNAKINKLSKQLDNYNVTDYTLMDKDKRDELLIFLLQRKSLPVVYLSEDKKVHHFFMEKISNYYLINKTLNQNIDIDGIIEWGLNVTDTRYRTIEISNQKILLICHPFENGGRLFVIQVITQDLSSKTVSMAIIVNLLIVVVLIIIGVISIKSNNSIINFTSEVQNIESLDFIKFPVQGSREMKELKIAVNQMSGKLKDTIDKLNSANSALEKELKYKLKLEEQRKQFVSDVSHELKTPIAIIQSYAEAIIDNVGDQNFYIESIFDEANNMKQLVTTLLELSKIESNNFELKRERINIINLLKSQIKSLEPLIEEYGCKIIINSDKEYWINVDIKRISQVIRNLVINGVQHGIEHGDIIIDVSEKQDFVEVKIFNKCDQKINQEELANFFNRFYKADKSRKRGGSGAGLGLAIVKDIINIHGGYCKAELYEDGIIIIIGLNNN